MSSLQRDLEQHLKIAQLVREHRRNAGDTCDQLAAALNISQQQVNKLETANPKLINRLSALQFMLLQRRYGFKCEEFITAVLNPREYKSKINPRIHGIKRLLEAYSKIKNPLHRLKIRELAEVMANPEKGDPESPPMAKGTKKTKAIKETTK